MAHSRHSFAQSAHAEGGVWGLMDTALQAVKPEDVNVDEDARLVQFPLHLPTGDTISVTAVYGDCHSQRRATSDC